MIENFAINDYIQSLLKASSQGLEPLTKSFADLLNFQVLVTSSGYEPISASFSLPDNTFFHITMNEPVGDYETLFLCDISGYSFQTKAIGRAIAPVDKIIGYIFILVSQDHLKYDLYKPVIDYAASLYAVYLQSRIELKREQLKAKNSFLYDLLYGNLKQSEEIVSMGNIWGWNFLCPHAVLLFSLPDLEDYSQNWGLMDLLTRTVEKAYSNKYYKNSPALLKRNELIIIIPLNSKSQPDRKNEILNFVERILSLLVETKLENKVCCGVGLPYGEPTELFRSYQEAKVSLVMGTLLDITVPFFSDLGLERILYKHDLQDLKEYYHHVLGELHKQDDHEGALIKTLEAFADNKFDVNKTAQAIFMHRNTLRYRLTKIENILGKSLNDIDTRLDIIAALKIKRLHKMELIVEY